MVLVVTSQRIYHVSVSLNSTCFISRKLCDYESYLPDLHTNKLECIVKPAMPCLIFLALFQVTDIISSFNSRSSRPEVFLRKGVLKICSKFTGEHPCRSVISTKLLSSFIKITLQHGCSPVNLLYIFRSPLPKNTSGGLLLGGEICSLLTSNRMLHMNVQSYNKEVRS